jgi:hypothetical protein
MVDKRDSRPFVPERRHPADPVDDFKSYVGLWDSLKKASDDRSREDADTSANPVNSQCAAPLKALSSVVSTGDHSDRVPPSQPVVQLAREMNSGAARLRVIPVAVGEDEDVHKRNVAVSAGENYRIVSPVML